MRALVVVAHPDRDSFTHAAASAAVAALEGAGHSVTTLDLYADGFAGAMTTEERRAYHGDRPLRDPMTERHAELVRQAQVLVFVYPTWWTSMPAILVAWLERVMVPGVAFVFDEQHRVQPHLQHVVRIVGISTYRSPWWSVKLVHDNGRRSLLRALGLNAGLTTRRTWLALYRIDDSTADQRIAFLQRVDRKLRSL
jgi:putative NADPH-quinone reductase